MHFQILTQQLEYIAEDGKLAKIKVCPTVLAEPDSSGRRKPVAIDGGSYLMPFDIAVEAIGQKSPAELEKILPGVETQWGLIKADKDTCETARSDVFAGGDIVRGASTVVAAVADGMKAARNINEFLVGQLID